MKSYLIVGTYGYGEFTIAVRDYLHIDSRDPSGKPLYALVEEIEKESWNELEEAINQRYSNVINISHCRWQSITIIHEQ